MQPILIAAIVDAYPRFRASHPRPERITAEGLRESISLSSITFLNDVHERQAYVRYGFSCAWDRSGFVVITHRDRVVAAGCSEVMGHPVPDPQRLTPQPKPLTAAVIQRARDNATAAAARNPTELSHEVNVTLPPWAGFRTYAYDKPSLGVVRVSLTRDGRPRDAEPITAEQSAAYRFSLDHAETMQRVVLAGIIDAYPEIRSRFEEWEIEMPAAVDATSLRELVSITGLTIHDAHADGLAYVGYELNCAWDHEHALGVMTHRERVVDVGDATTAIVGRVAVRDRDERSGHEP